MPTHYIWETTPFWGLPSSMYPIILPSPPEGKPVPPENQGALGKILTFAERYARMTPDELRKTRIPEGALRRYKTKNEVLKSLLVDVLVSMHMVQRWGTKERPEVYLALEVEARCELLQSVAQVRSGNYRAFALGKYRDAYRHCKLMCDAEHRGHLAPKDEVLSFSVADVEKNLGRHTEPVYIGIILYSKIREVLLSEASLPS